MRITSVTSNYYTAPKSKVSFAQAHKKNDRTQSSDTILKLWAAGALTTLAMAYAGGRMIISDYEKSVNEILDKYEQEIKTQQASLDSIYNEFEKTHPTFEIESKK